ncbi:DUF881 domain-containing protein [Streptomyces thermolineatus]|uniref:DUF881 domain-containing protein n=1 Tax=Streptomyces thermolineatus TaxID=44033 RepID=UPI000CB50D43|nr:hypothetical protein C0036_10345 [Streptomyces sp. DJ]
MCGMPQHHPSRGAPRATQTRPDASMSLLNNVMEHSLDDGYAEAAARRGAVGRSGFPRMLRAQLVLAAGLLLAALVVTLGAVQARVSAPAEAKERQELVERIERATSDADELQKSVNSLRTEVDSAQNRALKETGPDREAELVELLAGAGKVSGPGVELVVDDARGSGGGDDGPRGSSGFSDSGRVRDRDLQRVVNGLWASGAEAVAINGQRLTALSAIRAAGDAILVDNRPLAPPYEVLAIGDGQRLADRFRDSAGGRHLHVLEENYGVRVSTAARAELELPAAPSLNVRSAEPVAPDGGGGKGGGDGATAVPGDAGDTGDTGKGTS